MRLRLAAGNKYCFPGYQNNGFKINSMSLPGTESDDGGLPGVSVTWLNHSGGTYWYPVCYEDEFWNNILFANAVDLIDIGDHIHHTPTGEDWVVKSVDETHVEPAGWPPCRAKLSDCRLIKKATPEQREEMRRKTR
jgi:hypothetical protein